MPTNTTHTQLAVYVAPTGVVHLAYRHGARRVYVPCPNLIPTPAGGLRIATMGPMPPLGYRVPQLSGQRCKLPATHPARTCVTAKVRAAQQAHIARAAQTWSSVQQRHT